VRHSGGRGRGDRDQRVMPVPSGQACQADLAIGPSIAGRSIGPNGRSAANFSFSFIILENHIKF
jgi:hypothetical protein